MSQLLQEVAKRIREKKCVNLWLRDLGYSKEEIKQIKSKCMDNVSVSKKDSAPKKDSTTPGSYYYNKDTDMYVINLKCMPKLWTLAGEVHRDIIRNYSGWINKGMSITAICRKFAIPRRQFEEYRRLFNMTHDSEPISKEELDEKTVDELAKEILEQKKFALAQKVEKDTWDKIRADATNWNNFLTGELEPFIRFLETYNPDPIILVKPDTADLRPTDFATAIVGVSDWHFGAGASSNNVYSGKAQTAELSEMHMYKYAQDIVRLKKKRNVNKVTVVFLGDILHGLRGETVKGTKLTCSVIEMDQYRLAIETIINFLATLCSAFSEVRVTTVRGNHDGIDCLILMDAISRHFRLQENIVFELNDSRWATFTEKDVLFLYEHGASDKTKHVLPTGKNRQLFIQEMFLQKPELLQGIKQRVYLSGDKHHHEHIEYGSFEYYMFGCPLVADEYADSIGLHNRPRQNILIVDSEGISATEHVYFE